MSKTIISPVKRWPGSVTIPDFLTIPQAIAWEKGLQSANRIRQDETKTDAEYLAAWQPAFVAVVESWDLENFDPNRWPLTPRTAIIELTGWLIPNISDLYDLESEDEAEKKE